MSQEQIEFSVYYAGGPTLVRLEQSVPNGTRIGQWLESVRAVAPFNQWPWHGVAIFGERVELTETLRAQDRVEWLVPLRRDPKEARRLRVPTRKPKR